MRIAYTSGPYRGKTIRDVVHNIRAAEEVAIKLWQMGFAVICPHTNTQFFDGAFMDLDEFDGIYQAGSLQFIKGDIEFLKRFNPELDIVVMLQRWQESSGATQEYSAAVRLFVPVYYWPFDTELLKKLGSDGK